MTTKKWRQRNYDKEITIKKWQRNGDDRVDNLFPNSVIVLSCILLAFQIRTYARNPPLRSKQFKTSPLSHLSFTRNPISSQGICSEDGVADIGRKLGDDRSLPVVEKESKSHPKSGSRKLKHNLSGEKIAPKIYI